MKKLDENGYCLAHLTLILSLHYLVKCRSRTLAVYINKFILCKRIRFLRISFRPENHWKSVTYLTLMIFILILYVDELKWRINSEWAAFGRALLNAVGEWRQSLPLVFVWKRIFWAHAAI